MRTLDFTKEKVQVLTLEELEQSYHENHVDGTPVNGIYHFVLIQQMLELFSKDIPSVLPQQLALIETMRTMVNG